jgi:hypothetical protein
MNLLNVNDSNIAVQKAAMQTKCNRTCNNVTNVDNTAGVDEVCLESTTRRQHGTTQKHQLRQYLLDRISDLKKELHAKESTNSPQIDPLYETLKQYHDDMLNTLSNVTTEKLSSEVLKVIKNVEAVGDDSRKLLWSNDDHKRLDELNKEAKMIQPRNDWTWAAADDTPRGIFNNSRMKLCADEEFQYRIIHCPQCKSTGLLVGATQIHEEVCHDCLQLNNLRSEVEKSKRTKAWEQVRPQSSMYPKRTEQGHTEEDLPELMPGDKAVISPVHPVVTVKKNYFANKKLRQECISLLKNPQPTWNRVLPRTSLKDRFMVIERTTKDNGKRYIVCNPERVHQWLLYLFQNHTGFKRMRKNGELELSEECMALLNLNEELAEVDDQLLMNAVHTVRIRPKMTRCHALRQWMLP